MELTGKIIAVLPERSGTSSRTGSEWKAGSYVLETMDQFPRKMVFDVFGADRIAQFAINVGDVLTVSFDIDAHEYQGRWFNSIRAYRVDRNTQAAQPTGGATIDTTPIPPAQPQVQQAPSDLTQGSPFDTSSTDDLPF